MRPYPLPAGISRERFLEIVNDLRDRLSKMGTDPDWNMTVEDKECEEGGRHCALFISQCAAELLESHPGGQVASANS